MKKDYIAPEFEMFILNDEDIIITSSGYNGGEIDAGGLGDDLELPFV